MEAHNAHPMVLFLSVGSGAPAKLEETLYTPISKSISSGDWHRIVLLPSQRTLEHAGELKRRYPNLDVHIRPLPFDVEGDADACYDHFQNVIADLGVPSSPNQMAVDITRGTKAMSAALLLAASRYRIPRVRYVEGDRDPTNPGIVLPGSERVRDIQADVALNHRILDDAHLLFVRGGFAAASVLLHSLHHHPATENLIRLADFYAAWDRLDYGSADEITIGSEVPPLWAPCLPPREMRRWVHGLATPFPDRFDAGYAREMAARLRLLIVDLLANGERRVRQGQFEDAVLRAYRVLEMLGQARLFDQGLDSARLPSEHPVIQQLRADLEKKDSSSFGINKDGTLNASRELVTRLLKRLQDPLAADLLNVGGSDELQVTSRNRSVLIHGYGAVGPGDQGVLDALYDRLRGILRLDHADFDERMEVARFPSRASGEEGMRRGCQ